MHTDRWCLLTIAAYTANLAAALIAENGSKYGVTSVEDAISRQAPVCVFPWAEDEVRRDYPTMVIDPCADVTEGWRKLNAGTCSGLLRDVVTWNLEQLDPAYNPGCLNEYVGRSFLPAFGGFAVKTDSAEKCSSLIHHILDAYMWEMKQDGTIDQFEAEQHLTQDGQTCGVALNPIPLTLYPKP